jgi:cellulose synthase/poly-beta-1,6-N-acetylglucosamine synthase-like glycosyltransferase
MAPPVPWGFPKVGKPLVARQLCPRIKSNFLSLWLRAPVSLLVPAYNKDATIATTVQSMLQLNYPEYEVIVINDDPGTARWSS